MMKNRQRHILLLAGLILLLSGALLYQQWKGPSTTSPGEGPLPTRAEGAAPSPAPLAKKEHALLAEPTVVEELRKELIAAGWERGAARRVVELNDIWFRITAKESPRHFRRQKILLADLGAHPEWHGFIERHPETASLLLNIEERNRSDSVMVLREAGSDLDFVLGLYARTLDPVETVELTEALSADRDLMARLAQRGLIGSEVLFLFDRSDEAGREYNRWLREELDVKLSSSDEESLAEFVHLALVHGDELRDRMREDEGFRTSFRKEHWPKLMRVVREDEQSMDLYLNEPHVWDLLELDVGVDLLKRWGPLAIRLLYDADGYPDELHAQVITILREGDDLAVTSLVHYVKDLEFHRFLKRPMTVKVRNNLLRKLAGKGYEYRSTLRRYNKLSDSALAEESGPPPSGLKTWIPLYYAYHAGKKAIQGREVSGMDWAMGAMDVIATLVPPARAGSVAAKAGGNATLAAAKQFGQTTLQRKVGKLLAKQVIRKVRTKTAKALGTEIGSAVKLYRQAGKASKSLARMEQKGLQLMMRSDQRVFVKAAEKHELKELAKRYLDDLAQAIVEESPSRSVPGEGVLKRLVPTPKTEEDRIELQRKNLSAWWLMSASS